MKKGFVALVGAGPGNLGLLTLRGKEYIEKAETVVYDRLVSTEILALIPVSAKKIDVGKKSSNHLVAQDKINEILLEEAQKGNLTVRLKGGDPYLFGRGGEELELLKQHNIDFEVVPGITSAIAVPSYAGIPVTHRDFCSSLHIITGHQKNNEPLKINFEALVALKGTLVFLMGVSALKAITAGLKDAKIDVNTPVAVIRNGTRYNQEKVVATIDTIVDRAKAIASPAIIVVGEVASLSDEYDWFSKLPLFSKKVIVTRPKMSGGTLSKKLTDLGADVYDCPVTEIIEITDKSAFLNELNNLHKYNWLVFTSKNGVEIFFNGLKGLNKDVRILGNLKIAAIGSQTKETLREKGIIADYMPEIFDGENLAKGLSELQSANNFLLLRAKDGNKEIVNILGEKGKEFTDLPIYYSNYIDSNKEKIEELVKNEEVFVTFTSASTVEGFNKICKANPNLKAVCIGKQTASRAKEYGYNYEVANSATIDSVIEKLLEVVNGKTTQITEQ